MQRFSLNNARNIQTASGRRLFWVIGLIVIAFFALSFSLMQFVGQTQAATPPSVITYQGKILENGSSVTTSKAMAFLIYDAAAAGNLVYTASGTLVATTTVSITPTSGIFSVNLGGTGTNSIDPSIFGNNATLYLEVIVAGTTLSPRKQITSAPYATNAQYLLGYSPSTASTSQYIPLSNTDGNFTFTGSPTSTAVSGGIVYINPASATGNFTLFGIALNGNERFRVDEGGNTWIDAALTVSTSLWVGTTSTINGNAYVGAIAEAISTTSFVMNGDDMYVHDLLGVGDSVYIEDSLYIGTSTLRLNGSNAGGVIAMTNASLTIDSDTTLNINTINNQNVIFGSGSVGINSTTPAYLFSVEGSGYFSGTVTATDWYVGNSVTLGGVARTSWPSGGSGGGAWTTTTNLIYPNNTTDVVVIGKTSTSTTGILEVEGNAYINGRLGINTTSPQYDLSVVGTSNISGAATFAGPAVFNSTTTINNHFSLPGRAINPVHAGSIANGDGGAPLNGVGQLFAYGSYLYGTAFDDDDLTIMDISDPANISYVGSIAHNAGTGVLLDGPGSVYVQGDYAYVAANVSNALTVIDVSDPSSPTHVSSLADGGAGEPYLSSITQVFVSGNYAYVTALGDNALQIIDISDPYHMKSVGSIVDGGGSGPFFNQPYTLFIRDGYAYVISYAFGGTSYFNVIDIDDPTNPVYISSLADGGASAPFLSLATAVVATDHYAYVSANGDDAMQIIDISDPSSPTAAGSIQHNGTTILMDGPRTTYVAGDYAYTTAENSNTLSIIDISDASNPTIASTVQDGGVGVAPHLSGALGVATRGNYVFVGSFSDDDVEVIDVTGARISNADIGNAAISILHVESPAFFNDSVSIDSGLSVGNGGMLLGGDFSMTAVTSSWVGATNTLKFAHTALFQSQASSTDSLAFRFDSYNTINSASSLFSIRNNGTEYFNLSGSGTSTMSEIIASNGITLGGVRHTSWPSGATDNDWVTSTGLMYPLNTTTTIVIGATVTSSATTIFEVTGNSYFNGNIGIASTSPNYALSVTGQTYITATTTVRGGPTKLVGRAELGQVVGSSTISNLPNVVKVVGDYAYVGTSNSDDFNIIDISDADAPRVLGTLATGDIEDLVVAGRYVYASSDVSDRLLVIDVSNPTAPVEVAQLNPPFLSSPGAMAMAGNYVYVTDPTTIYVFDVSNQDAPVFVASTTESGMTDIRDITVYGQHAYISSDVEDRLRIFDISDPMNLFHTGSIVSSTGVLLGGPREIVVRGSYAYVAGSGSNGIEIVDISDPTNPSHAGSLMGTVTGTMVVTPLALALSGDYLYVGDSFYDVVSVVDVSSSTNPLFIGPVVSSTNVLSMALQGNYLYTANALPVNADFQVVDISGAVISNADIGAIRTDHLSVHESADFSNSVAVHGALSVGSGGFLLSGDFSMSAVTTTPTATNTLRFSHTTLFKTSATSTSNHAFIFDTQTTWPSSTSQYLLSLRTGGTPAFSVTTNGDVHTSGTLFAANATVGTPGAPGDLAERVDIAIDDTVGPGDVVVVDAQYRDTYRRSTSSYSEKVAGVISTNPTIVIGNGRTTSTAVMAMTGRVPVKVTTENGPISRGDLLITASTTGYAMRYDPSIDPGTRVVGIIGMALDAFAGNASTTQGTVLSLIRTGWIYNQHQTISDMQTQLAMFAAAQGQSVSSGGNALNVSQIGGQLTVTSAGNLDLGWKEIRRVMAVRGQAWEIDPQGRFVTKVDAGASISVPLYAVQSQGTQLILSGASILEHGRSRIDFSTTTRQIIDPAKPIRVSIALTSESNGMFVENKSESGFDVVELNNGRTGNATFDWVAIVERRLDVTPQQVQQAVEEAQVGGASAISSASSTPTTTPSSTNFGTEITSTTPEIASSTPTNIVSTTTPITPPETEASATTTTSTIPTPPPPETPSSTLPTSTPPPELEPESVAPSSTPAAPPPPESEASAEAASSTTP